MRARHLRVGAMSGALVCLIFFSPRSHAWDAAGHEIVATIAFDQMNPKARAEAVLLAPQMVSPGKPYDPVTISCWMDDLRDHSSVIPCHGLFLPWHYIDFGITPGDPEPVLEPGQDNETSGNIVTALKRVMVVLQGGTDPYVTSRAMAYAMAMHLVGDIHQPLHAAAYFHQSRDGRWFNDRGGNSVAVINGPVTESKYNLHYFWDSAWRVSFDDATGLIAIDPAYGNPMDHDASSVKSIAEDLEVSFKPDVQIGNAPDFTAWAKESNQLARDVVYPQLTFTENHRIARVGAEYVSMANSLARKRLVLAGFRLAALLNATLGSPSTNTIPSSYPSGPLSETY